MEAAIGILICMPETNSKRLGGRTSSNQALGIPKVNLQCRGSAESELQIRIRFFSQSKSGEQQQNSEVSHSGKHFIPLCKSLQYPLSIKAMKEQTRAAKKEQGTLYATSPQRLVRSLIYQLPATLYQRVTGLLDSGTGNLI